MRIEVLHTARCPTAAALVTHLRARGDVELSCTLVTHDTDVPACFAGSPTVLVDGANPFGGPPVGAPACALRPPTAEQVDSYLRNGSAPT